MNQPTRSRQPARRKSFRGAVMLEAIIASGVFAVGVMGAYQGIIIASRQNSMANRMVRGSAIGQQIRSALESQGYNRLNKTGGAFLAGCSGDATVKASAGGLQGLTGACVIDLDTYESGAGADLRLQPLFSGDDKRIYKRVLVLLPATAELRQVGIVVSWSNLGQTEYHRQWITLLLPTINNGKMVL
ncbi:MAG TPA: prepilin cleavage protein [Myxococcales bacterium]|jgi:hypothetical protein